MTPLLQQTPASRKDPESPLRVQLKGRSFSRPQGRGSSTGLDSLLFLKKRQFTFDKTLVNHVSLLVKINHVEEGSSVFQSTVSQVE